MSVLFPGTVFTLFGVAIRTFSTHRLHFNSKLVSYSESAAKTESIHMFFKYFWDLDFFVKKSPLLPLRLHGKIDFCAKCYECCGKKLSSLSNINKSKTQKDWRIKTSFRAKSIFDGGWGGVEVTFWRKSQDLKNIWKTYESTQFLLLIPNLTLVLS